MKQLADTIKEVVFQLLFIKPSQKFIMQLPIDELQLSSKSTNFLAFFLAQLVKFLLQSQVYLLANLLVTSIRIFSKLASKPTNPTRSLAGPHNEFMMAALTEFLVCVVIAPLTWNSH